MKVFEDKGRINFVDINNVLVGYNYEQDCCENFGYFFSEFIPTAKNVWGDSENKDDYNLDGFVFNKDFFRQDEDDETNIATFELNNNTPLYLTLYNVHNGYYSHGFSMIEDFELNMMGKRKPKTIKSGAL